MMNTLDLAVAHRAKYLFTSSSVVYGRNAENKDMSYAESDVGTVNHLAEYSCYDEGKRFAETCVATYRQVYGLDAKIARVFTTYGPRMRLHDNLFVADFILDALEETPLKISMDQEFSLSLCYVTDMIDGLVRLMHTGPETVVANLGHDQQHALIEIAKLIVELTGSTSQIMFEEPDTSLQYRSIPDLRFAKEHLGWIPIVGVRDGLKKMIDYTIANKEIVGLAYTPHR
jgi:nucleoside-diphosphate-sugar epimerase